MRVTRVLAKLEPGGAQLTVLSLTRELRRLGVETRLLAGHATPAGLELFQEHGIEVESWNGNPEIQYACDLGFAAWLEQRVHGSDLVHAHMFGAWWAMAQGAPPMQLVASEHNDLRWPGVPPDTEIREALARVALFFAHGPAVQQTVLSMGIARERLRPGLSPVGGFGARPRPELPRGRIVYAGRLHHEKGPDLLVEALGVMRASPPVFILGSGPMADELQERVRTLGLDGVHFTGWVNDPERWLAGAAACVVPSRHDAFSRTAVLAMGLGTPVIGAAVEGLPDTLGNGRGLLFRPDDPAALAEKLDGLLAGRLTVDRRAARHFARSVNPVRVAAAYLREYRALCG